MCLKELKFELMLKNLFYSLLWLWLMSVAVSANPVDDRFLVEDTLQRQINSVKQLSDVKSTDWTYEALRSLVDRYQCLSGYPDSTFRGNSHLTRYEFAVSLNVCLNQIASNRIEATDLSTLIKLQTDFSQELSTLKGRVNNLDERNTALERQQFSTTTKLKAQIITAYSDTFGDAVGNNEDKSETFLGNRGRLNFESSFTGQDLLRVRLEFGNFFNEDGDSKIALATGTGMTRLNFDDDNADTLSVSQVRYYFPVNDSLSFVVGTVGIGYTDITQTITPATIADGGNGIPSLFGEYNPIFRKGGGGAAVNYNFTNDLTLTLGYLADNPSSPLGGDGLFNGGYNALAHLSYVGDEGAVGVAYSHGYASGGEVSLTGGTGSSLSISPFGDSIATSSDTLGVQGFYIFSDKLQIHAWGGYIWANAKNSGFSAIANGLEATNSLFVDRGDNARSWYGAIGFSFPDVGGEGNLPGILVGVPPHVTTSDVREEDNAYHVEAFYRWRVNNNISITPGFWTIFNPENNSSNNTQYVGVLRTTFDL